MTLTDITASSLWLTGPQCDLIVMTGIDKRTEGSGNITGSWPMTGRTCVSVFIIVPVFTIQR